MCSGLYSQKGKSKFCWEVPDKSLDGRADVVSVKYQSLGLASGFVAEPCEENTCRQIRKSNHVRICLWDL